MNNQTKIIDNMCGNHTPIDPYDIDDLEDFELIEGHPEWEAVKELLKFSDEELLKLVRQKYQSLQERYWVSMVFDEEDEISLYLIVGSKRDAEYAVAENKMNDFESSRLYTIQEAVAEFGSFAADLRAVCYEDGKFFDEDHNPLQ